MKTIQFVCSGNYCRLPLAEGLARLRVKQAGLDTPFSIRSAGTQSDYDGQPRAPLILEVLREIGADGPAIPPHQITPDEVEQAAVIFGVAQEHVDWISRHYPAAASRAFLLSDLIGERWDVRDPGVQALGPLRECRDAIDRILTVGLQEMIQRAGGGA